MTLLRGSPLYMIINMYILHIWLTSFTFLGITEKRALSAREVCWRHARAIISTASCRNLLTDGSSRSFTEM
jgi:hypothetical protein